MEEQSKELTISSQSSPFDALRLFDKSGREYWSARDLQTLLGYTKWEHFEDAIERAMISCRNSGQNSDDHFPGAGKLLNRGNRGGTQEVKDYRLTRYACYLTAMNGDPRKAEISAAQTYFAIKAREAEIAQEQLVAPAKHLQLPPPLFRNPILDDAICPAPTRQQLEVAILTTVQLLEPFLPNGVIISHMMMYNAQIQSYRARYSLSDETSGLIAICESMVERGLLHRTERKEVYYYHSVTVAGRLNAPAQ